MDGKNSFVLYADIGQHLDRLTDEEAGQLFKGLVAFASDGTEPIGLSPAASMAFSFISAQIVRDTQKWLEIREKRRDAGHKGGVAKSENAKQVIANVASANFDKQDVANVAVNVNAPAPVNVPVPVNAPAPATVIEGTVCGEPKIVSPPVITLPLNDGSEYSVSQSQCQEWETLYPAVDVMQQLRNMRGWLLSNPDKRKTKRGIQRFITAWLAKDQDRGGSRANSKPAPSDEKNYDVLGLMGVKI